MQAAGRGSGQRVPVRWQIAIALCLGACTPLAAPAAAQDAPAAPEEASVPAEEATAPGGPADPYDRGTPRSAVHAYLVAARAGDYERAAHYLDLRRIPEAQRDTRGPRLARDLKLVLDRTLWVDIDAQSSDPQGRSDDGLAPRRDLVGYIEREGGQVPVYVQRVQREDGVPVWKFAADTVARVPELYEEFGYGELGRVLPAPAFQLSLFEILLWQWVALLLLVVVAAGLSWVVATLLLRLLRPIAGLSRSELDDQILHVAAPPARLAIAIGIFAAGFRPLGLAVPAHEFLRGATGAASVVALTWLLMRFVDMAEQVWRQRLLARGQGQTVTLLAPGRKTVKIVLVLIAVVAMLDNFGFDVTALIAGLGVGGLAVALAAQKTVENLFGGITLYADRPVRVGDFCRFGDRVGTVEEIGLRSTRVRTLDRTLVSVPNAEFSTLQLENYTRRDMIWYHPTIGLRYETTPDQLRYVLVEVRKLLYAHPRVDPEPARIRFTGFGAFSLDLVIFAYVRATDWGEYLEIAEDLNLALMDVVERAGTGFAFPSNTTYLAQDEGLDAERADAAQQDVRDWRERGELHLPRFPQEVIDGLRRTHPWPPEGTSTR